MKMTSYLRGGMVFDLRTSEPSGSAREICKSTTTRVIWGAMHTRVELLDCDIQIYLDAGFLTGKERDADEIRERAMAAVVERMTFAELLQAMSMAKGEGQREGAEHARAKMRKALGL